MSRQMSDADWNEAQRLILRTLIEALQYRLDRLDDGGYFCEQVKDGDKKIKPELFGKVIAALDEIHLKTEPVS